MYFSSLNIFLIRIQTRTVRILINFCIFFFQDTTFLDYIRGGLKLHFVVAIDFSTSNGMPNDPNSLHYLDRQRVENPYTMAIRSVGEIFQDYDSGKILTPFWRFYPKQKLQWQFYSVEIAGFSCHLDFTWNQFWRM